MARRSNEQNDPTLLAGIGLGYEEEVAPQEVAPYVAEPHFHIHNGRPVLLGPDGTIQRYATDEEVAEKTGFELLPLPSAEDTDLGSLDWSSMPTSGRIKTVHTHTIEWEAENPWDLPAAQRKAEMEHYARLGVSPNLVPRSMGRNDGQQGHDGAGAYPPQESAGYPTTEPPRSFQDSSWDALLAPHVLQEQAPRQNNDVAQPSDGYENEEKPHRKPLIRISRIRTTGRLAVATLGLAATTYASFGAVSWFPFTYGPDHIAHHNFVKNESMFLKWIGEQASGK